MSFITPARATRLQALRLRGFQTQLVLGPTENLLLWRRDVSSDAVVGHGPTSVTVHTTAKAARPITRVSEFAEESLENGWFTAVAPWDVEKGDTFTLSSGVHGHIGMVPPPDRGLQQAAFVLED